MSSSINITGLEEIYRDYDTFILDQWGVMHNGIKGYLKAIKCIENFFLENKNLIIISNSSKRKKSTLHKLPAFGFNPNHFQEVMTSGEMIWQSLFNESYNETKNLGKNCFHIYDKSKEEGDDFFKGIEKFKLVNSVEESDFILGCTPFADLEVLDYVPILDIAIQCNIPFICANPDFETIEKSINDKNIFCIGTIAELYKNMGGEVFLLGKPNIDIYTESTKNIYNFKKSRVLAIGDSLHHDIKGALNFGIDSLLITSTGIHQKYFNKRNLKLQGDHNYLKNLDIKPTFTCSELVF
jgi:HAD superfamily hydrolase (TIGR01459 family)